MDVDVTKESLCINKVIGPKIDAIVVEGDIIVPDVKPDILNVITTTGNVCVYKKEILDGRIRFDGEVNIYVMYLADNENDATRSLSASIDFTQIIDMEEGKQEMDLDEQLKIKSMDCKVLNGRKINVKAMLQVESKLYANETVEVVRQVNNIEDIQSLKKQMQINSLVGKGCAKAYAKETLTIDNADNLAEILRCNVTIVNKDTKISYNKVLAKADAEIKIMYLTEDNRIKVIENKIPVMGFVDVEGITDTSLCDMKYKLKNVIVKPNQVEEHSIYVEVETELYCRVYENKEIAMIQDLYSPCMDLKFSPKKINTLSGKCELKNIVNIREKVSVPEIAGNQIYDVEVIPNIVSHNVTKGRIVYEGEMEFTFIYASGNVTGVDTKKCKLPFSYTIEDQKIDIQVQLETSLEICSQNFIVGAEGLVECNIDLQIVANIFRNVTINVIDKIEVDETRQREIYSMIIYFVKPGDTLWEIAKKFKSTVEDIARVNTIEEENKIYPGQQLFIPKYVDRKRQERLLA